MRFVEVTQPGGPQVLRIGERPKPRAGAGEVLIAVKAAGVSRADVMQREGKYPPPPGASDILGLEVSGIVEEIGDGQAELRSGDEVCALLTGGGYAEYVAVPAGQVLRLPANWNFVEGASLPENMFTVYDNLFIRGRLRAGESVLVHGGTSGIGTTAIMLAKAFGARFVACTAGSDEKCAACRDLGAELAVNYKNEDFVAEVLRATKNAGVNVVLDVVGGDYIARDVDALSFDGRVVCLATARGSAVQLDLGRMLYKRASILASSLRARTVEQKTVIRDLLREHVWPLLPARNTIRPAIDSTFPIEEAAQAHRRMESSQHIGKIVLTF